MSKTREELKDILNELDKLNKEMLVNNEITDRDRLKVAKKISLKANIMVTLKGKPSTRLRQGENIISFMKEMKNVKTKFQINQLLNQPKGRFQ